jgi:hypothetical protein
LLQALLKGKLTRKEENLEDLLTSNVFGAIEYVPFEDGLSPLLKHCVNKRDEPLFAETPKVKEVHYQFWPWLNEVKNSECEPDVLITVVIDNGQKMSILVEAKFHSGKSSEAIQETESNEHSLILNDQLVVEWENLVTLAKRKRSIPVLLYVPADIGFPTKSIEDSCREYKTCRYEDMNIFWISWRKLPNLFMSSDKKILLDLVGVLKKLSLVSFEKIKCIKPPQVTWTFQKVNEWDWSKYKTPISTWKYQQVKSFNWNMSRINSKWEINELEQ